MKKLMIAALAVTAVGGAFAAPLVYDYKASVKHMYERLQRANNVDLYVKYVKSSKLNGFFIQDIDAATTLARSDMTAGYNGGIRTEKRGFLVVLNSSAETAYRRPKIMPAQLDVKSCVTRVTVSAGTTRSTMAYEAYFYAGPFASAPDDIGNTTWTATQDDGVDYLFYGGAGAPGVLTRSYGTFGSTLYMFGQHNTYNRWDNTGAQPAVCAFGDAWLNGAGFGSGTATGTACCGWGTVAGGFNSISGNLKGGLFLCSISGYPANSILGYFALGLEDLYRADVGFGLGHLVQGDLPAQENGFDENVWADGDIALNTSDVVSGSWTLKRRTATFNPTTLTAGEIAWFAGTGAPNWPASQEVAEYVKTANQMLDRSYSLTVGNAAGDTAQPENRNGQNTAGLIPFNFAFKYF